MACPVVAAGHRLVLAVVVVVTGTVVSATGPAAAADQQGDAQAGRAVFEASCAMCHGGDAAGMMGMHPSLRGAIQRLTREGVEVAVRRGRDTNPPMPAFDDRLDDRQIADVIAYLDTLPPGPRNFGPEADGRGPGMMDGGMTDRMMSGGGAWFLAGLVVGLLVAALAGGIVWVSRGGRRGHAP